MCEEGIDPTPPRIHEKVASRTATCASVERPQRGHRETIERLQRDYKEITERSHECSRRMNGNEQNHLEIENENAQRV